MLLLAVACLGLLGCACSFIVLSTQVDRVSCTKMVVLVVMVMKERVSGTKMVVVVVMSWWTG